MVLRTMTLPKRLIKFLIWVWNGIFVSFVMLLPSNNHCSLVHYKFSMNWYDVELWHWDLLLCLQYFHGGRLDHPTCHRESCDVETGLWIIKVKWCESWSLLLLFINGMKFKCCANILVTCSIACKVRKAEDLQASWKPWCWRHGSISIEGEEMPLPKLKLIYFKFGLVWFGVMNNKCI